MATEQNHEQMKQRWAHLGEPELSGFVNDFKLNYYVFGGVFVVCFSLVFAYGGYRQEQEVSGKAIFLLGGALLLAVGVYLTNFGLRNRKHGWGVILFEEKLVIGSLGVDREFRYVDIAAVHWQRSERESFYSFKTKKKKSVQLPPTKNVKEIAESIEAKIQES